MKSEIWKRLPTEQKAWFEQLRAEIRAKYQDRWNNARTLKDYLLIQADILAEEAAAGVTISDERNLQIPDICPRCNQSMKKFTTWRQYAGHNGLCNLAYKEFNGDLQAARKYLESKKKRLFGFSCC